MEVNKEEALRCLSIAQRHRGSANLPSALKFAKKSVALYSTPEGEAMVSIVEREIRITASDSNESSAGPSGSGSGAGESSGSGGPAGAGSSAKASGVEEHVSAGGARQRPGHGSSTGASGSSNAQASGSSGSSAPAGKKREYTAKQLEVVKRVKSCKHHEYYEILAVERTCTENDVKKAYKKLALALHPDKNGAPGADEAFKMVSKAFQVLSDGNTRAAFDSNPSVDPTQRNAGMGSGMRSSFFQNGGGGGPGMYQQELNPEDLFNMFFGGGGFGNQANVFSFGGPGGFQAQFGGPRRHPHQRPGQPRTAQGDSSPLVALLPIIILFLFAFISMLPSLFSTPADPEPGYTFQPMGKYDLGRKTWQRGVEYFVNKPEWENSAIWQSVPEERRQEAGLSGSVAKYSGKVRVFEMTVENYYINRLRNECNEFEMNRRQQLSEAAGIFGIGADYEKIRQLRSLKSQSCEQLRSWGLLQTQTQQW